MMHRHWTSFFVIPVCWFLIFLKTSVEESPEAWEDWKMQCWGRGLVVRTAGYYSELWVSFQAHRADVWCHTLWRRRSPVAEPSSFLWSSHELSLSIFALKDLASIGWPSQIKLGYSRWCIVCLIFAFDVLWDYEKRYRYVINYYYINDSLVEQWSLTKAKRLTRKLK